MGDFLLCRPTFYGIDYQINPWMDVNNAADKDKAINQWNSLVAKIEELGAKIHLVEPVAGLPDMVFTANAGLILKNKDIILSKFAHPERSGEEDYFDRWFSQNGYKVIRSEKTYEGAGDSLYLGNFLIGGYGFRTDPEIYLNLTNFVVRLVNPYFYHLDTCFCPLEGMDYMIFPGAFDQLSLEMIRGLGATELAVPEDEAKFFACNSVRVGRNVILPAGCPETMLLLEKHGYTPHPLEMSEFIKSGGACKCLTLAI